jgi:hypothetical protein
MNTQLRFAVLTIGFMGALFGALSQSSAAGRSGYKVSSSVLVCDSKEEATLCINEPSDAPETVILANETTSGPSMLMPSDLAGGELSIENEALLALAVNPLDLELTPGGAIAEAQRANAQIREVEVYLKTASPEGDLTVISAGQK